MYGNDRIPGVSLSEPYRSNGSIWQGAPESTWFKIVGVNGTEEEGAALEAGTILKQVDGGNYAVLTASDIISVVGNLPGARLAIVADKTAKTGTSKTTGEGDDAVTEAEASNVLVGVCGKVDKAKLYVGDTVFTELTDAQQVSLSTQLEAWGFMLVNVMQG